jgi:hypothetical protein
VKGTRRDADARLTEILRSLQYGDYVEPSKLTFGDHVAEWLEGEREAAGIDVASLRRQPTHLARAHLVGSFSRGPRGG